MEATISSKGVKLFSQMIKCLGKVGEELYLEAYPDKVCFGACRSIFSLLLANGEPILTSFHLFSFQLLLKTLNAGRSAYFSFSLVKDFFEGPFTVESDRCTCKVLLKVRNLQWLSSSVHEIANTACNPDFYRRHQSLSKRSSSRSKMSNAALSLSLKLRQSSY